MRTGLTKQEKTTEIYFGEKDPTIFLHPHPQHRPQKQADRPIQRGTPQDGKRSGEKTNKRVLGLR